MISGMTSDINSAYVIQERQEQPASRILELRKKIHSEEYINSAILRIAQVISRKLVETQDELILRE